MPPSPQPEQAEATSREEAIAKAREQHGPDAQITQVRPVRRGGVFGFFATERYVADVAPDTDRTTTPATVDTPERTIAATTPPQGPPQGPPRGSSQGTTGEQAGDVDLSAALADLDALFSDEAPVARLVTTPTPTAPAAPGTLPAAAATRLPALDALTGSETNTQPSTTDVTGTKPGAKKPVSPFAAALARMSSTGEVNDAVSAVVEGSPAATIVPLPGRPTSGTVPDTGEATGQALPEVLTRPAPPAAAATPGLRATPYNLAAALVSDRGTGPRPVVLRDPLPVPVLTSPPAAGAPTPEAADVATEVAHGAAGAADRDGLLMRLAFLGVPAEFLDANLVAAAHTHGSHAALTRVLRDRLPKIPALPVEPAIVLVIGPGAEALTAARSVAMRFRADPDKIRWASPPELAGLVPAGRRIASIEAARDWAAQPRRTATTQVIGVSAAFTAAPDGWVAGLVEALAPDLVLVVADATRKPADVTRWVGTLPQADGLLVHNTAGSATPGTYLSSPASPVLMVDGKKATPARWASLLCERLTEPDPED